MANEFEVDADMEASLKALEGFATESSAAALPYDLDSKPTQAKNTGPVVPEEDKILISAFSAEMHMLRSFKGFSQYLQGKPKTIEQYQALMEAYQANDIVAICGVLEHCGVLKCRCTKAVNKHFKMDAIQQRRIKTILQTTISPAACFQAIKEVFTDSLEDTVLALGNVEALRGISVREAVQDYLDALHALGSKVGTDSLYPSKLNSAMADLEQLSADMFNPDNFEW